MKQIITYIVLILSSLAASAQVGINTTTPSAALEVDGNVIIEGSLTLENPGDNSDIRGSKFLIRSLDYELMQYDISTSKYGPINFAEFAFKDVPPQGLLDYDTKISIVDYVVSVQGYTFAEAGEVRQGSIMPHSIISDDNIEGYQMYAYANPVTQTWWIKAFVNNSEFQVRQGNGYINTPIDLYLNIMMYRKGFITKTQSDINVNMGGSTTTTAPLPAGF
ncbi:MAG: hypothetical protein KJO23_06875 [Bacteroidia bacterium]|nr:hypothetical protein [Bacteroidia bacterium]NNM22302.1 hypothetical protein [Flavobacteriaceae bacterium]